MIYRGWKLGQKAKASETLIFEECEVYPIPHVFSLLFSQGPLNDGAILCNTKTRPRVRAPTSSNTEVPLPRCHNPELRWHSSPC